MNFSKLTPNLKYPVIRLASRNLSTTPVLDDKHSCRLLVVGGGAGGCTMAAKFAKRLGKNKVIVLDPASEHYYQPMFTLVGGGLKTLPQTVRPMRKVLPSDARWLQDEAVAFDPQYNRVCTKKGDEIQYDFMIVALGIQLNYYLIPGVLEGLSQPGSGVCSNYSPKYVKKTFEELKKFEKGNAIFTFPNTPIKCAGAPQKILYIAEEYLRKHGKRENANLIYNTALPVIFGVKVYADALWKVVKERNITVNTRRNLIRVSPKDKKATFEDLDTPGKTHTCEYSMLHVTPPQSSPNVLRHSKVDLIDAAGFLNVNKETLQHLKYPNIYGIGDSCNAPTSKTAAAVAGQAKVVETNLTESLAGRPAGKAQYDGYTSCPLVTGRGKCILAEFDYNLEALETLPIRQDREMAVSYFLKASVLPEMYWNLMLKGNWNGPKLVRKALHLGFGK